MEYIVNADDVFYLLASEKKVADNNWKQTEDGSWFDSKNDCNYITETKETISVCLDETREILMNLVSLIGEKLEEMEISFKSVSVKGDYIQIEKYRNLNKKYTVEEDLNDCYNF